MLVKIKQLVIENTGYKRDITHKNIYINTTNIVSIADYIEVKEYLISEDSSFTEQDFSLIKVNEGTGVQNIVAFGSAEQIHSTFKTEKKNVAKEILNG